ncbi:MAG TPA: ABC transporter permease subunit [Planctomycetaceae bacterium]|nr:ABC transporter permease subunit [Planctomycetaceae bacterium]
MTPIPSERPAGAGTPAARAAPAGPIHDLGYRGWQGATIPDAMRWWVIAATGVRMAWKSMWLRRMLFFAWMPAFAFAVPFFVYEQALQDPGWLRGAAGTIEVYAGRELAQQFQRDPSGTRHLVWSWLIMTYFQSPQAYLMIVLIALVVPPLISRDLRSRAFLLYFSRPLTRSEYVLGKAATVWCFLLLITAAPSLALYVFGVLLSPDLGVLLDTWDIPLRILAATVVVRVPTTALALWFSSMTTDSRYAAFAWFAVWVLGYVTWTIVYTSTSRYDQATGTLQGGRDWKLVSLIRMLHDVESWVFGMRSNFAEVLPSLGVLTAITVVSVVWLFRRVAAPMRI